MSTKALVPSAALLRAFSSSPSRSTICNACMRQQSLFHTSQIVSNKTSTNDKPSAAPSSNDRPIERKQSPPAASAKASKSTFKTPEMKHRRHRDGELQPKPLSRPLGLPYPPQPGQNTGRDTRTISEKRDDFANYEKHLERRQQLIADVFQRNYYKDIGNLGKVYKGKSIVSPSTPFRAELALYFPNLEGMTLESGGEYRDTTPILLDRISIVSMLNTEWATSQAETFTATASNPDLAIYMRTPEAKEAKAQFVTINVEENMLKAAMIRLFSYRLRKQLPKEQWSTYFLNRQGVTEEIRDALGMWNSKVGYVYLVDGRGRIRWAGNGEASEEEKQSLVYCLRRLVAEGKEVQKVRVARQEAAPSQAEVDQALNTMFGAKA